MLKVGVILCVATVLPAMSFIAYSVMSRGGVVSHEGTVDVLSGEFYEVPFTVWYDRDEILYRFTVESGPAVDVYMLSDEDFARYLSGQAVLERFLIHENVTSVSESPYFSKGPKHAVIDNTAYGVAVPDGSACIVKYYVAEGYPPDIRNQRYMVFIVLGVLSFLMFVTGLVLIALDSAISRPLGPEGGS